MEVLPGKLFETLKSCIFSGNRNPLSELYEHTLR
jgi:hypothetical protein